MSPAAPASLSRLQEIVGAEHVLIDGEVRAARAVDGLTPSAVVRPADAAQVAEVVRFAAAAKLAVIPSGSGTKLGIGAPPSRYDLALDLSRMNHILAYDPRDLTLGVEPGVRIADLLRTLAEQKQFLPLAVPFADRATLGGIAAANSSSPLRHAFGGVRDFCLGMEFITGDGTASKSGGRVVKNVSGYDLHKLLIGSLGTLGVITRVNFRTFPLPPAQKTFVASFESAEAAFALCRSIARSPLELVIVEVADPRASEIVFSARGKVQPAPKNWLVIATTAGQAPVVERHARDLARLAVEAGAAEFFTLEDAEQSSALEQVREFPRLAAQSSAYAAIFRINALPTAMSRLAITVAEVAARHGLRSATMARAAGIHYAALLSSPDDAAAVEHLTHAAREVFELCATPEIAARAMLEWCPTELKRAVSVWGAPREDFPLMARMKKVFDPSGILAPGRFAGGL